MRKITYQLALYVEKSMEHVLIAPLERNPTGGGLLINERPFVVGWMDFSRNAKSWIQDIQHTGENHTRAPVKYDKQFFREHFEVAVLCYNDGTTELAAMQRQANGLSAIQCGERVVYQNTFSHLEVANRVEEMVARLKGVPEPRPQRAKHD